MIWGRRARGLGCSGFCIGVEPAVAETLLYVSGWGGAVEDAFSGGESDEVCFCLVWRAWFAGLTQLCLWSRCGLAWAFWWFRFGRGEFLERADEGLSG